MDLKRLQDSNVSWVMNDGSEMKLTLNFGLLYLLRSDHKAHYDRFFRVLSRMGKATSDQIFDSLDIIYVAYLCQELKEGRLEEALPFEEWICVIPQDSIDAVSLAARLVSPKKAAASEANSRIEPTKDKADE